MIDNKKFMEGILQKWRFRIVLPYLYGDVMDFGGNKGELGKFVKGEYFVVNYDHSVIDNKIFDTIVSLAVIEHIEFNDVFKIFRKFKEKHLRYNGRIIFTTPTKMAKPVLQLMALLRILNKDNISEHKHYWSKKDIYLLADKSDFKIEKFKKFQLGFNQLAVFRHKD